MSGTTRKSKNPSKVIRINNIHLKKLKKIGDGDQQKGLEELFDVYEKAKKNPEAICMNHIACFMDDLQKFYGDNHYDHFENFPMMVRQGLQKGFLDPRFLKKRLEEPIDKFTGRKV